jgi:hypothetical protein
MIIALTDSDWMWISWVILSVYLAYKLISPKAVYWLSVLLASICVFYFQYAYYFMEMGGILHTFIAGLYPLLIFIYFRYFKNRKNKVNN